MEKPKKLKDVLLVIGVIVLLLALGIVKAGFEKNYRINPDAGVFTGDHLYKSVKYGFQLTYPEGSIFRASHPESGFVTRFFLPNSQTISGDQENIGVYVRKDSSDLESIIKTIKDPNSKKPMDIQEVKDIQEVQFGGQKGYRIIFVSGYSAPKKTRELSYLTVKDGKWYVLNYFPVVDTNLKTVDDIAKSFEFIQ